MSSAEEVKLTGEIEAQGNRIRELKAAKASKEEVQEQVALLLALKTKFKEVTGKEFVAAQPAGKPAPSAAASDSKKKEKGGKKDASLSAAGDAAAGSEAPQKKSKKDGADAAAPAVQAPTGLRLYLSTDLKEECLKCLLVAELCKETDEIETLLVVPEEVAVQTPSLPVLTNGSGYSTTVVFGANAICRYLSGTSTVTGSSSSGSGGSSTASSSTTTSSSSSSISIASEHCLDVEEFSLAPALRRKSESDVAAALRHLEAAADTIQSQQLLRLALYPSLAAALIPSGSSSETAAAVADKFPKLRAIVDAVARSPELMAATERLTNAYTAGTNSSSNGGGGGDDKDAKKGKAGKKDKKQQGGGGGASSSFDNSDVVVPSLPAGIDWDSEGLISSLKLIFDAALKATFPQCPDVKLLEAVVFRCANPAFGDFQCNNAMALSKSLKGLEGYTGPVSPKDIAERIVCGIPKNPIVESATCAPNGFVNIKLSTQTMTKTIAEIITAGLKPPSMPHKKVLVDFSSPNIAKEMHVGHLRSTIIGDCVCRIFEFLNYEVMRVNHVGDWGTQFGMLITYLRETYPDILTNPPNISDLTAIYKESKKRFDADEKFKETARNNVVNLQAGDPGCTAIWTLLCNISRAEFQKVYDALDVKLTEYGESFYNPMIPGAIEELQKLGLVEEENGMLIIKLPHFTIPLIVRKSDGGYGYDSTDMAAVKYRLHDLDRDWCVYITDAGQANHFHMCFDAAKAAGWVRQEEEGTGTGASHGEKQGSGRGGQQLNHIGFGVVQGEDGKRFKTRSNETVRLIDLLDAAKDRMKESLQQRAEEGKSPLQGEELEAAAKVIGYGAVKYFDLKQHPGTNYIFSYDRMLDTKGDTAVYLLFAYARLVSILRKAKEERQVAVEEYFGKATATLSLDSPAERALAFELLQFGDVLKSVIKDLLPNRLCDYLKEVATKFTDFVTKCHVLNPPEGTHLMHSRLLLCVAAQRVMQQCFHLLGIGTLDRI